VSSLAAACYDLPRPFIGWHTCSKTVSRQGTFKEGTACSGVCLGSTTGNVTATCVAGSWEVDGACTAAVPGVDVWISGLGVIHLSTQCPSGIFEFDFLRLILRFVVKKSVASAVGQARAVQTAPNSSWCERQHAECDHKEPVPSRQCANCAIVLT
jgi:hypothetical protein